MSKDLQPGDLCVVVDCGDIGSELRHVIGSTVILTHIHYCPICDYTSPELIPFWTCAGLEGYHISHVALRKIPPAPEQAEIREEELCQ